MGFTLFNIFKAGLLIANAVAILHPKRFLAKYGYDQVDPSETNAVKTQTIGLLQAVGYLKVPLIAIDVLVMIVELLFG
jgi:hypothetical protein